MTVSEGRRRLANIETSETLNQVFAHASDPMSQALTSKRIYPKFTLLFTHLNPDLQEYRSDSPRFLLLFDPNFREYRSKFPNFRFLFNKLNPDLQEYRFNFPKDLLLFNNLNPDLQKYQSDFPKSLLLFNNLNPNSQEYRSNFPQTSPFVYTPSPCILPNHGHPQHEKPRKVRRVAQRDPRQRPQRLRLLQHHPGNRLRFRRFQTRPLRRTSHSHRPPALCKPG